MAELRFVLAGQETDGAAAALVAAFGDGDDVAARMTPAPALPQAERRVIDPISLAALIVSLPGAALAVWDLADRIRKRRRAQAVVAAAQTLRAERQVETWLIAADQTPRAVADLDADRLLDLVAAITPPPD
ncbi:MAG TPA: hypothetical protein VME92_16725 [Acetobacteraceae bacterium]|nr:hypothetical protein [Acetobacteraceae bacterium]